MFTETSQSVISCKILVICLGYVDYEHQTDQLNELGLIIQSNEYIDSTSVDYWYFGYEKWRKENCKFTV